MSPDLPLLYKGSVKDVLGPVTLAGQAAVIFKYSDAYSVFDWGRMPDALPHKGEALAIIAAFLFEKLEDATVWREFSRTPAALGLRKGVSEVHKSPEFNELGERLQQEGLRTHYIGCVTTSGQPQPLSELKQPVDRLAVRPVSVVKPDEGHVMGRVVMDYRSTLAAPLPRLIPLEMVFRFSCPPGSSYAERAKVAPGQQFEFPVIEMFTKLEPSDRLLEHSEALAISGLSPAQMQDLVFKTAWVAGFLKAAFSRLGLELADGKLEWALDKDGSLLLVDAIGPDELRLLSGGVQISKEFLRTHYRQTKWYDGVTRAKKQAQTQGTPEWKRFVGEDPPSLPQERLELASQLYLSIANTLTGRSWFSGAWDMKLVIERIRESGA